MRDLRDFFFKEINSAMCGIRFDNWLIRNFLVDLLDRSARWTKDEILVVRKDPAIAFEISEAVSTEKIKDLSKKLLFVIGFFPESLVATGKRRVGLGYYLLAEKSLLCRLHYTGGIWRELNINLKPTIRSLNGVRANVNIKQPDIYFLKEIEKATGDVSAFYKFL